LDEELGELGGYGGGLGTSATLGQAKTSLLSVFRYTTQPHKTYKQSLLSGQKTFRFLMTRRIFAPNMTL
jgi:hypothetical protein